MVKRAVRQGRRAPRIGQLLLSSLLVVLVSAGCTRVAAEDASPRAKSGDTQNSSAAAARGKAAAGDRVALPKAKVGIMVAVQSAPSAQRQEDAATAALDQLGWEYQIIDGQGVPTMMADGIKAHVDNDVDFILNLAGDPSAFTEELELATKRGIPVFTTGGRQRPSPLIAAQSTPNDYETGAIAAEFIVDHLSGLSGSGTGVPEAKVGVIGFDPILGIKARGDALDLVLEEFPGIKVVARHQTDLANLYEDTRSATLDMLRAHPDLDVIMGSLEPNLPAMVAAVEEAGREDDVALVGYFAVPAHVELLKAGKVAAVIEAAVEVGPWALIDLYANARARGKEVNPADVQRYAPMYGAQVLTPENVNADYATTGGRFDIPMPPVDYEEFFRTKWTAEFENVG